MSQFRRLFVNKPMDPLVKISDRVYVLDCSFSNNVMGEDEYKLYFGGVVAQLQVQFQDTSFMVFNFREGVKRSQISDFLSQYDMPVMDYPSHYQSCPLLPLEKIHRFLRLCESWLQLEDKKNVVLLHCERGGWPVLSFMLSGLLLYTKQFHGEKKTLEIIHSHVPKELFHLFSPLNPKPSQLRYLEYISRRNLWPSSSETPLLLDCLILKDLPLLQGRKGCRPVLRVYGQDSKDRTNMSSILLFATPKTKKHTRLYQQEECILVKLDIKCRVQGDVVLECVHLHDDLVSEEMVFRIMFHTEFLRANVLMVQRDEMDILWDAKDKFSKEFKAEVLFSGADAMVPAITRATISEDENDFDVISPEEFVNDGAGHRRDLDSFVVVDTDSDDSRDSDSFVVVDPSSDDSKATSVLLSSQASASPPPTPPLPTYSSQSQKSSHSQKSQLPPPPPPPPPSFASKRPNNGRNVLPRSPLPRPRKFVYGSTPVTCSTSQPARTSPPPPPPPPPFTYVNDIMLPPTWESLYGLTFEAHVACSASSPSPPPPPPSSNTRKANGVGIPPPPPLPYRRIAPSPSPKAPPLPPTKTTPTPPFSNVRSTLPPPPPISFGKTSAPPPPPPPLFRFGASRLAPTPPMYGAPPLSMRRGAPLPPPPPPPPPPSPVFGARRAALIQRGQEERMRMALLYYNHLCLLDEVTNGY